MHQEVKRSMPEDEAEVTGVFDDKNDWVPFDPPLRISLRGVPAGLAADYVESMVAQHLDKTSKAPAPGST